MAGMNECINTNGDLKEFCLDNDLLDTVALMNPSQMDDATYLYGKKRIDYIFITPALTAMAVKAGHHQFDQHFVSDHKGVYIKFRAGDLFDNNDSGWGEEISSNDMSPNLNPYIWNITY